MSERDKSQDKHDLEEAIEGAWLKYWTSPPAQRAMWFTLILILIALWEAA